MEKTMNFSKLPSTGSPTFMLEMKLILYLLNLPVQIYLSIGPSFRQLFAKAGSFAEKRIGRKKSKGILFSSLGMKMHSGLVFS